MANCLVLCTHCRPGIRNLWCQGTSNFRKYTCRAKVHKVELQHRMSYNDCYLSCFDSTSNGMHGAIFIVGSASKEEPPVASVESYSGSGTRRITRGFHIDTLVTGKRKKPTVEAWWYVISGRQIRVTEECVPRKSIISNSLDTLVVNFASHWNLVSDRKSQKMHRSRKFRTLCYSKVYFGRANNARWDSPGDR